MTYSSVWQIMPNGKLRVAWGISALAMDAYELKSDERWVTYKPNGNDAKGRHCVINGATGEITQGNPAIKGKNIDEVHQSGRSISEEKYQKSKARAKTRRRTIRRLNKEYQESISQNYELKTPLQFVKKSPYYDSSTYKDPETGKEFDIPSRFVQTDKDGNVTHVTHGGLSPYNEIQGLELSAKGQAKKDHENEIQAEANRLESIENSRTQAKENYQLKQDIANINKRLKEKGYENLKWFDAQHKSFKTEKAAKNLLKKRGCELVEENGKLYARNTKTGELNNDIRIKKNNLGFDITFANRLNSKSDVADVLFLRKGLKYEELVDPDWEQKEKTKRERQMKEREKSRRKELKNEYKQKQKEAFERTPLGRIKKRSELKDKAKRKQGELGTSPYESLNYLKGKETTQISSPRFTDFYTMNDMFNRANTVSELIKTRNKILARGETLYDKALTKGSDFYSDDEDLKTSFEEFKEDLDRLYNRRLDKVNGQSFFSFDSKRGLNVRKHRK